MEKYYKGKYRIASARLKGYDYASDGSYFVTICTRKLVCHFGEVMNSQVILSDMGTIAYTYWKEIPVHFDNIILDEFKIMPNHIHGIIIIDNSLKKNRGKSADRRRGGVRGRGGRDEAMPRLYDDNHNHNTGIKNNKSFNNKMSAISPRPKSLPVIIGSFKSICTRSFNRLGYKYFAWQPRFHDHIIRNQKELENIRKYIINNPANWEEDEKNLK